MSKLPEEELDQMVKEEMLDWYNDMEGFTGAERLLECYQWFRIGEFPG